MSILDTSPHQLLGSSLCTGVPSASSIPSKTRSPQTWKRQIGDEETRGRSSGSKPPLREEDTSVPAERDLSHDLHIRESSAVLEQVCHDIRQPVVSLLACVELLIDSMGTGITAEQKELIASMQASSQCMLELVDDSLELAFAAARTLVLEPSLVTAIGDETSRGRGALAQTHSEFQRKR